jgi:predicted transposase YbfD/YdcC
VASMYEGEFFRSFELLEDTREEGKVKHKLLDILFLVISGVICGCNTWEEVHLWSIADMNIVWLEKYIQLKNGIPSLSTIGRLFDIINPKQFEKCFIGWMKTAVNMSNRDIIPIDGKTMRGSKVIGEGKKGAHIVNALCCSNNLVIGQVKTEEKSNEITAIPELLDMLFIQNCIVTLDAMGLQKKIVTKIVNDNKADYVISLKGNQETLMNEVENYFNDLEEDKTLEKLSSTVKYNEKPIDLNDTKIEVLKTLEKGHGRIEKRSYFYSQDIEWMIDAKKDWTKLTGIGMVLREIERPNKEKTVEKAYHIASVNNVVDFSTAVRNHWAVESMHWSLDVTFRDDANRTRKGRSPQNMAVLKRIAFNTVKNDTKRFPKKSMASRRFIASVNFDYRDFLLDLNFKERE